MNLKQQFLRVLENISNLDRSRKIALVAIFGAIFIGTLAFSVALNRSAYQPLYSSLPMEDINNISRLLAQNGIAFKAQPEKGEIEVSPSSLSQARILLAEQGLPSSRASGYDLFDQVNTFGLTSFMQDVTNKRAIEGELVRTLRMIEGITAARVHLVMPEKNAFRRDLVSGPSASVIVKTTGALPERSVYAVRNVVAAAVPGLGVEGVTLVDTSGTTIAAPGDETGTGTAKLIEYESQFERDLSRKIATALGPFLGESNYRVSVTAKLNNDQRRLEERLFDPDSRVARSEQSVREARKNENRDGGQEVSVQQNLPEENEEIPGTQISRENDERREETINYEINETRIETQSGGYSIEAMSVALVVNNQRVLEMLGENPDPASIDALKAEIKKLIGAAVSASDERGDKIEISILDFIDDPVDAAGANSGTYVLLATHMGSIVNAVALLIATAILSLVVVRPLITFLGRRSEEVPGKAIEASLEQVGEADGARLPGSPEEQRTHEGGNDLISMDALEMSEAQSGRLASQLQDLVERSEDRVAAVLRRWLMEDNLASKS